MSAKPIGPDAFINRELSWLAFNERVLEEAADPSNPLLERVKFVAIAVSNLDEFFMVRVAGLVHAVVDGDKTTDAAGLTPARQLEAIQVRAHEMIANIYELTNRELLPALGTAGIRVLAWRDLSVPTQQALSAYFRDEVLPVLTPLAIDMSRPFPLLASLSLNLALRLAPAASDTEARIAIVQLPQGLTRLVPAAGADRCEFILLEDIIKEHLSDLFPGQTILESALIRLARDAELELDDEGGRTQLEVVERELRRRRKSDVVRLEVTSDISSELLALISERLDIGPEDVYQISGPLDLRVLMQLVDLPGFDTLRDEPHRPVATLESEHRTNLFSVLDERDLLIHHPYESYDPVLALIDQAASDPAVVAIRQTLYRTSAGSAIIASLQRAAEANKQVTVLVELTARFDEERNITWARALEEAGAHVIYGVRGYKTHAKVCLIVRRTPRGLRRYVHLGTGNYNERTARLYTDFSLLTSSQAFAEDATAVFTALTGYSDPPRLKRLVMAPTGLRVRLLKLIDRERRRAEAGQPAEIAAKMNSLTDEEIIAALYRAAESGVSIRLNVRGMCSLRPGVPGVSERIEVVSIVDRFLEHSRIYTFLNGGDQEVYLASADWMNRNLDKRVELMFPIESAEHKSKVLAALNAMFADNIKARWLAPDGTYHRKQPAQDERPIRAQVLLQEQVQSRQVRAADPSGVILMPQQRRHEGGA
jgi:polyphosphate kinase